MSEDKQKELGFETYMRGMTGGVEVLTPDAEQLRALEGSEALRAVTSAENVIAIIEDSVQGDISRVDAEVVSIMEDAENHGQPREAAVVGLTELDRNPMAVNTQLELGELSEDTVRAGAETIENARLGEDVEKEIVNADTIASFLEEINRSDNHEWGVYDIKNTIECNPGILDDPKRFVEWIRYKRDVKSQYRGNAPMTTRLDRLVLHALDESQPEALQELGRRCITDNPAAEEEALRWAVLVDPMKDDHEKAHTIVQKAVIIAKENEAHARTMYEDDSYDEQLKKIGMSMSSMRYYLWDHTGDRRLAVQAYLDLADSLGAYDEQVSRFASRFLPYHNGGYERNDAVLSLADIVSSDGFKTAEAVREMSGVDIFRYDSTINFYVGDGDAAKENRRILYEIGSSRRELELLMNRLPKGDSENPIGMTLRQRFLENVMQNKYSKPFEQQNCVTSVTERIALCNGVLDMGLLESGSSGLIVAQAAEWVMDSQDCRQRMKVVAELKDNGLFDLAVDASLSGEVFAWVTHGLVPQERLAQIKELERQGLFETIGANGPLAALSSQFFNLCVNASEPASVCTNLRNIAGGEPKQLWWLNLEYSKLLVGVAESGSPDHTLLNSVPTSIPIPSLQSQDQAPVASVRWADMSPEDRRFYLDGHNNDAAARNEVYLNELSPEFREATLAQCLYESIRRSRDTDHFDTASERNARRAAVGLILEQGDLVHATRTTGNFNRILLNGLLCGETIGTTGKADTYPFNVDFVESSLGLHEPFSDRVKALQNKRFGSICMVIPRESDQLAKYGVTHGRMDSDHRLVFGAVPSTEIAAVILRDADEVISNEVVRSVVDHGIYIPVYDSDGGQLLTHEQYRQARLDGNYDTIQPEIVDHTFKRAGTQGGSNEGAWFLVRSGREIEDWYVKFGDASREDTDHTWTEILADRFYAAVTPRIVSETKPIIVEGRFARGSKKVDLDLTATVTDAARNEGFVMDCLLGNWDAVFNLQNLVMDASGHAMRIDTGNSFDFRARNGHKAPEDFTDVVREVEFGIDPNHLDGGMRQKYPGIDDEQIASQVRTMKEKLSDEKIDELVDSIRRTKQDREMLKRTMKARRDYLVNKFL